MKYFLKRKKCLYLSLPLPCFSDILYNKMYNIFSWIVKSTFRCFTLVFLIAYTANYLFIYQLILYVQLIDLQTE